VLRFTDGTAEEIRKAGVGGAGATPNAAVQAGVEFAKGFRKELHENVELRLLEDVMSQREGAFFLGQFRMGGLFTGRSVDFVVDPEGTFHAAPDQVELTTWGDENLDTWAAYTMTGVRGGGIPLAVTDERMDVAFEKSGAMRGSAETTLTLHRAGLRVLRLNLFRTLRVAGVFDETGAPLDFVQEDKEMDPQFAVLLPEGVKAGATVRLLTKYAGKDVVRSDGGNNYYLRPDARESWYPAGEEGLGEFANFRMTFHLPKELQIVATGKQVSSEKESGGGTRVVWQTDVPIAVAGFNLGEFKSGETKTPDGFTVSAYANEQLPDWISAHVDQMNLGTMTTVGALKYELSQGSAAIQVYTNFFGKLPYDHVALTQQGACNFGQSWPMLVYLPLCAFWDSTIQQRLGLLNHDRSYWQEVTPHEVAHQWWGQLVGFNSYRDQWMSEGFANFSVGLFLLNTSAKTNEYHDFWNEQKKNLLERNAAGMRPIDVGGLTMGYRVSNEKAGEDVYQLLIYSKGAYVLHMLEMMWWTPKYGNEPFKRSIQKFVSQYSSKAATTEDLKASFEQSMPGWVNLSGDGKLDWFFDEYVYGTELPHYTVAADFSTADGETTVHFKVSQSNVSKSFVMPVPLYLQMENGNVVQLGKVTLHGEATVEKTAKLGKLASPAKRLMVNYNADVLSD
jgi:hypothetical protein